MTNITLFAQINSKLDRLGIEKATSKSTISYQNKVRSWEVFKGYYFLLLKQFGQKAASKRVKFLFKLKKLGSACITPSHLIMCAMK